MEFTDAVKVQRTESELKSQSGFKSKSVVLLKSENIVQLLIGDCALLLSLRHYYSFLIL